MSPAFQILSRSILPPSSPRTTLVSTLVRSSLSSTSYCPLHQHSRHFSIMTVTSYTSDDSHIKGKDPEDGQVVIHSKQPRTKTQAEIEKEKWVEVHRLAVEVRFNRSLATLCGTQNRTRPTVSLLSGLELTEAFNLIGQPENVYRPQDRIFGDDRVAPQASRILLWQCLPSLPLQQRECWRLS